MVNFGCFFPLERFVPAVNLYKCEVKRPTCGDCLASLDKYKCGWCYSGGSQSHVCSLREGCSESWLRGDALCPDATITDVSFGQESRSTGPSARTVCLIGICRSHGQKQEGQETGVDFPLRNFALQVAKFVAYLTLTP